MMDMNEHNLTEVVLSRLNGTKDKRIKQIMESLIRHAHAFVRDVELTEGEWFEGIKFLTNTGQKCDEFRQEFILLSDTLGISMLVDAINHRKLQGGTESTVFGPFYRDGAPTVEQGGTIVQDQSVGGEPSLVTGHVRDPKGKPIVGAVLDIWQTAPNGLYETQDESQPDFNLRGKVTTGKDGEYAFTTIKPVTYPIPTDGPVGRLLAATGRHPNRPAHIHFIVSAKGFRPLTTHIFAAGDSYLESDAVFGVKKSLIADFTPNNSKEKAAKHKLPTPFLEMNYEFVLEPA